MNKKLWVGIYIGSYLLFLMMGTITVLLYMLINDGVIKLPENSFSVWDTPLGAAAILLTLAYLQFLLISVIFNFAVLSRMWSPIQDGQNPITVGKAIGFLFIPIFSVYWIFRAWGSYPTEYNNFVNRHNLTAPVLSSRAYAAFPLFLLLSSFLVLPILFLPMVFAVVIARTADAYNNLLIARSFSVEGFRPDVTTYVQFGSSRAAMFTTITVVGVLGFILFAVSFAIWNARPSPRNSEIPEKVNDFTLQERPVGDGSIFGLRSTFVGSYRKTGNQKDLYYRVNRFLTESFAKNLIGLPSYLADECERSTSQTQGVVKDRSGMQVGEIVICSDALRMRNRHYVVTLSTYGGATEDELLRFALALPINKDISVEGMQNVLTSSTVTSNSSSTSTSNKQPVNSSSGSKADISMIAEEFYNSTNGANRSSALAKFKGKTVNVVQ